jgi:hypothetical protein
MSKIAKARKVLAKCIDETIKIFSVSLLFPNFSICDDIFFLFLINIIILIKKNLGIIVF